MVRKKRDEGPFDEDDEGDSPEDDTPYNIPSQYQNIDAERFDITIRELWDRYSNNNVVLQPPFQRNYVWDDKKASRYVESLLLGFPKPPVFVAEETNGQWVVIDGHQRLASLFRFMRPLFSHPAEIAGVPVPWAELTPLRLVYLQLLSGMNLKEVTEIPKLEREQRLWQIKIPVVKIGKKTNPNMKYELFARLNLGSLSLNPQELRNCLYRGPYNELLIELSKNRRYLDLWKKEEADKRMKDRERVLRFFAFLHRMESYSTPLKEFLNDDMEENQNADEGTLKRFRNEFNGALTWVERIWGSEAFKQYKMGTENTTLGHWVSSRYDLIYDVEMVGFGHFDNILTKFWESASKNQRDLFRLLLRNRLVAVMTRDSFVASLLEGTWRRQAVNDRYNPWLNSLEFITSDYNGALSEALELHNALINDNICLHCGLRVPEEEALLISLDGKQGISHIYCQHFRH